MKDKVIKFLKIYIIFILFVLTVNLSMEMFIPTPEEKNAVAIAIFYLIFSFPGSLIFLLKNYKPIRMGLLSLIIGFILEFAFMMPDWVQNIYSFNITGGVVVAVIVSAIYWFIAWGVPAYILALAKKRGFWV